MTQMINQGGYDSDQDADDLQDAETAAWIRELTRGADDGSSYFGMGNGEEEFGASELDNIDEFAVFLECMQSLIASNPQALQALEIDNAEFKATCDIFANEVHRRRQEAIEEAQKELNGEQQQPPQK